MPADTEALIIALDPNQGFLQITSRRNPDYQFILQLPVFHYRIQGATMELAVKYDFTDVDRNIQIPVFGEADVMQFTSLPSDLIQMKGRIAFSHTVPMVGIQLDIVNHSGGVIRQETIEVAAIEFLHHE